MAIGAVGADACTQEPALPFPARLPSLSFPVCKTGMTFVPISKSCGDGKRYA